MKGTVLMGVVVMGVVMMGMVVMGLAAEGEDTHARQEEALRKTLFTTYHKDALPSESTNVSMGPMEIFYLQMDEANHRLLMNGWFNMMWTDPRLTWESEEYPTITHLTLSPGTVWIPDWTVYNGGDPERQLLTGSKHYRLLLYPTGQVLFVPSMLFHFTCIMDMTYWPHDEHNCSVKIGSWVYSSNVVDLQLKEDANPKNEMKFKMGASGYNLSTSEWEIVRTNAFKEVKYYPCCEEPYNAYIFSVYLRRITPAHVWMVKGPIVCLTLLSVIVVLLPVSRSGIKMSVGCLLLIADLIFLNFAANTITHNPSHTPLLVKLMVVEVVVVSISIMVSGLVCWLAHSPHSAPLPEPLKRLVMLLATLLCLQSYAREASGGTPLRPDEVELGSDSNMVGGGGRHSGSSKDPITEWVLVAAIIDRLTFVTYLVLTVIILIAFSSVL